MDVCMDASMYVTILVVWCMNEKTHFRHLSLIVPQNFLMRSKSKVTEEQRRDDARTKGGELVCINLLQCVTVCNSVCSDKADRVKTRYIERKVSPGNFASSSLICGCVYTKEVPHTQPCSSLSFDSAVSLSFCFSLSLRSWERERCPG